MSCRNHSNYCDFWFIIFQVELHNCLESWKWTVLGYKQLTSHSIIFHISLCLFIGGVTNKQSQKLYQRHTLPCGGIKLTTTVIIATNSICRSKFNYHTIAASTVCHAKGLDGRKVCHVELPPPPINVQCTAVLCGPENWCEQV